MRAECVDGAAAAATVDDVCAACTTIGLDARATRRWCHRRFVRRTP